MRRNIQNLAKLGSLADLMLDKELATLAGIANRRNRLRQDIHELEVALQKLYNSRGTAIPEARDDPPIHDQNWLAWRRKTKSHLIIDLANSEADHQSGIERARKAFGRMQAIKAIVKTGSRLAD